MQLPATDELVLASGLAPIRATKLRYFEDRNFRGRVISAPALSDGVYGDRPRQRSNDWGCFARLPDARLERAAEAAARPAEIDPAAQVALEDDDNLAADQRAMDQARNLTPAVRGFGINEGAARSDLIAGLSRSARRTRASGAPHWRNAGSPTFAGTTSGIPGRAGFGRATCPPGCCRSWEGGRASRWCAAMRTCR